MNRNTKYTYGLAKGCALIEETLALLSIYKEGMSKEELCEYVHKRNFLSRCTAKRSEDIVKQVFYPRFMKSDPRLPLWLHTIRSKGLMLSQFKQLLLLYCARENAIVYDYITRNLNELKRSNINKLPQNDILFFIKQIAESGEVQWSASIQKRNAAYIKSVLMDFDLVDKRDDILSFEVSDFTVLYLMHELHFGGLSDAAVWNHEDWQLFGLDKYSTLECIMQLNIRGGYIAQNTGDLLTISWNYQTMEDFINGTL
jgi:hypothetical protein